LLVSVVIADHHHRDASYRPFLHDRHFSAVASIGMSRGRGWLRAYAGAGLTAIALDFKAFHPQSPCVCFCTICLAAELSGTIWAAPA
jgi:hypothetical protein